MTSYRSREQISDCQESGQRGLGGNRIWLEKGNIFIVLEMFCILHCVDANILAAILCYNFASCYIWGELGQGYTRYFWAISYGSMIFSKENV